MVSRLTQLITSTRLCATGEYSRLSVLTEDGEGQASPPGQLALYAEESQRRLELNDQKAVLQAPGEFGALLHGSPAPRDGVIHRRGSRPPDGRV